MHVVDLMLNENFENELDEHLSKSLVAKISVTASVDGVVAAPDCDADGGYCCDAEVNIVGVDDILLDETFELPVIEDESAAVGCRPPRLVDRLPLRFRRFGS